MSPLRGWICFSIRFYKDVAPMALRLRKRELTGRGAPAYFRCMAKKRANKKSKSSRNPVVCKIEAMMFTGRTARLFALNVDPSLNQN